MLFQVFGFFLLPDLIFCSSSLYKKELVSHFTVHSSWPAKTLIHCGAICKSDQICLGFNYVDKGCNLVTQAQYNYIDETVRCEISFCQNEGT